MLVLSHEQIGCVGHIHGKKNGSLDAVKSFFAKGVDHHKGHDGCHEHHYVVDEVDVVDNKWLDARRQSQYHENVEKVATQHIAKGKLRVVLARSHHGSDELGQRSAHSHNGDGDNLSLIPHLTLPTTPYV